MIRILREPEWIIFCPSRRSATHFRKVVLQKKLAGINDGFPAKGGFDQIQPGLGPRDDLFLGLTIRRFEIKNRRQFPIVVHRFYIIDELGRLSFGINVAAEKVIRSSQESSRFCTAPVVIEGGVSIRISLGCFYKDIALTRRTDLGPVDSRVPIRNINPWNCCHTSLLMLLIAL